MNSEFDMSRKYAVGKMAEVMIATNKMIYDIQDKLLDASRRAVSTELTLDRSTSLTISPESIRNVRNPYLRNLNHKLIGLEVVGRSEWLNVFLHISDYMRLPRPVARGEWDEPKKFVQRQTLTLDGPYPGISNHLMIADDSMKPSASSSGKAPGRTSSTCSAPDCNCTSKIGRKMKPRGFRESEYRRKWSITKSSYRKSPTLEKRLFCDCREIASGFPKVSETGIKQIVATVTAI